MYKHTAEITKLVTEHELTIYGPGRQNGLRGNVKGLQDRMGRNDKRFYKMAGIFAGANVVLLALGWFIEHLAK